MSPAGVTNLPLELLGLIVIFGGGLAYIVLVLAETVWRWVKERKDAKHDSWGD